MRKPNFSLEDFKKFKDEVINKNPNYDDFFAHVSLHAKQYTLDEIKKIIDCGSIQDQQILSRYFYDRDGIYKRIVLYYATILKYSGILIPHPILGKQLSQAFLKKRYIGALEYIDRLKIPQLCTNISLYVLINGSYGGIILDSSKNGIAIIDLPCGYYRSRYRDLAGNDIIEFNVAYFDKILSDTTREKVLKTYPKLVSSYYKKYAAGKLTNSWVIIPASIGIYFSFFDDARPLFLNVIPASILYDDAVDTERERDLEEIRKIIVQKIPHLSDGQLLFEPVEAIEMHDGAVNMMKGNKNISVLTTYADVDSIVSKTQKDTSDSIDKMLQNVYSEAGASSQVFAPTGSQSLGTSITNDIAVMMILAKKYSYFFTYLVNTFFAHRDLEFNYELTNISWYNESEYITNSYKLAQSGYSFLLPSMAMGLTQKELVDVKDLENDLLKLRDKLIPLQSTYTQSSDSEGGAPEKSIEEKDERTLENEESLDNQ